MPGLQGVAVVAAAEQQPDLAHPEVAGADDDVHHHREDRDEHETAAPEPAHHGQQRELADDRERGELVLRGERDQAQGRAEVDEQQLPGRQRRPVRRGHRRDRPAAQQRQPGRPRVRRRPARHPRGVRTPGRQRAEREGQHRQQQDDADRLRREVVLLDPVEPDEQPGRGPRRAGAAEHRPGQRVHADRPDEHHHGREPAQHDVQVGRSGGVAEPRPLGEERGPEEAGVDVRRGHAVPGYRVDEADDDIRRGEPGHRFHERRQTGAAQHQHPGRRREHRHPRAGHPQLHHARAHRTGQCRPRRRAQHRRQAPAVEGVEVRGRRGDGQQREREQHQRR